jgi:hypothetical protein
MQRGTRPPKRLRGEGFLAAALYKRACVRPRASECLQPRPGSMLRAQTGPAFPRWSGRSTPESILSAAAASGRP